MLLRTWRAALCCLAVSWTVTAQTPTPTLLLESAEGTERVRNLISPSPVSRPGFEDKILFGTRDAVDNGRLLVTEGFPEDAELWAEPCPGLCGATAGVDNVVVVDGVVSFFVADDPVHGSELWRSDGTVEGTRLVSDLCRGSCGSDISGLTLAPDGRLFFTRAGSSGPEPWTSDGTAAGTRRLGDGLEDVIAGLNRFVFTPFDGGAIFQADDGVRGGEWFQWTESAGLRPLPELCDGPCSALASSNARVWQGAVYFTVRLADQIPNVEREVLYALESDGSFREVFELCRSSYCRLAPTIRVLGGELLIGRESGDALYASDGTTEGTRFIMELPWRLIGAFELANGERLLYFNPHSNRADLYRFDGDRLLGRLPLPTTDFFGVTSTGERLVVVLGSFQAQLWGTDGTMEGTELLSDDPQHRGVSGLVGVGGQAFFSVRGPSGPTLWRSDGTVGGTYEVSAGRILGSTRSPGNLTAAGERLLWTLHHDDSSTRDVLTSDGTSADIETLFEDVSFNLLGNVVLGGEELALFTRSSAPGVSGGLWLSDGTAAGSRPIGTTGGTSLREIRDPVTIGEALYFLADTPDGQNLWRTDGTELSTELVVDLEPEWRNVHVGCGGTGGCGPPIAATPIFPRELVSLGDGRLAFVGGQLDSGAEVWISDGSAFGTALLADLVPGAEGSEPEQLTVVDGVLFFTADLLDGAGRGLYAWPGSGEPARLVSIGEVAQSAVVGSYFVWLEDDGARIRAGRSDGSVAGTTLYASWDGVLGPESAVIGDRWLFVNADLTLGAELWATSPSAGSVGPVGDIWPGPRGSYPQRLTAADGALYFAAADPAHGQELWRYDAGASTPVLVADIAPGADSSSPAGMTLVGPRLHFVADAGPTGRELWSLDVDGDRCRPSAERQCLGDGRFAVSVRWRIPATGDEGAGQTLPGTDDSAYFWFFSPGNLELIVKVLDGTGFNGHHWVFYGALTDVEYWIDVEDLETGAVATYYNPPGQICGDADIEAFPAPGPGDEGSIIQPVPGFLSAPLSTPDLHSAAPPKDVGCTTEGATLCLLDRFEVTVEWRTDDADGVGTSIPLTDETGLFWFFDDANVELAVKVLDARAINDRFWVFYGALSDVAYTLRVLDTLTGAEQVFENPAGNLCGDADTDAFSDP
ncbi:MAG: hypothetical protein AAGM22_09050 [Acidobacteriota bacterium]